MTLESAKLIRPIKVEAYSLTRPFRGQKPVWCRYIWCGEEKQHTLGDRLKDLGYTRIPLRKLCSTLEMESCGQMFECSPCVVLYCQHALIVPRPSSCVARPAKRRNIICPIRTRFRSTVGDNVQRSAFESTLEPCQDKNYIRAANK